MSRDLDETTDHELVARIRAGDERAFECLYRRYHRRIASYVQGMVHDHARAEDITQDVFMSALRRMRDTDRPIAFKPWIYEIAKNACIDQFRRARRAEEVSYDAEEGLGSADYGRLVTKDPSPEVRYDQKQQLDHLRGAFGGLSETHHEILVMRELEGLSYREIGERLGMTRPAVESTLFRARRRLTEEYEELVTGERCQRVQGIIATAAESTLGARDRRRVARHVSYCQPCLRHARMSGMDASDLVAKPLRAKVAALLPLPAFLKKRWSSDDVAVPDVSGFTTWSAHAGAVDPGIVSSWGKAAATAATIAIAGVGAGVATSPPTSVQAALGAPSTLERLGGDRERSASASSQRRNGVTSAPTVARPVSGGLATVRERATGQGDATRRDAGGSSTSSDEGSSSGGRTTDTGAGSATSGSGSSGGTPARRGRLSGTLTRIGGGSGGSGSGGSSSTPERTRSPQLPAPALAPAVPTVEAPAQPAPEDPVGGVVEGVTEAGSTVTGTKDAAEGILAGE